MPEMQEAGKVPILTSTPPPTSSTETPPPPYSPSATQQASAPNPGFCLLAFSERHANRTPGGGMTASQYFAPCAACGTVVADHIPGAYKDGWREWVDPSVNFRWESHVVPIKMGFEMVEKGKGDLGEKQESTVQDTAEEERLSCWVCWEYEEKFLEPMVPEEWYLHQRKHFKDDGFRVCVGKTGGMQRRRNCSVKSCPKIHS